MQSVGRSSLSSKCYQRPKVRPPFFVISRMIYLVCNKPERGLDLKRIQNLSGFLWFNLKYQIFTKGLLILIVFPIYRWILGYLIQLSGRDLISSGDYRSFVMSLPGLVFFLISLAVLGFLVAVDINSNIIMSALSLEGKLRLSLRQVLWLALIKLKKMLNIRGIVIMVLVVIMTPLLGLGIGVSATNNFQIPNFIQEVIDGRTLYFSIYLGIIAGLLYLYFRYLFVFHGLILSNLSMNKSLQWARDLSKKYWPRYLKTMISILLPFVILSLLGLSLFVGLVALVEPIENTLIRRILTINLGLYFSEITAFIGFLVPSIIWYRLTQVYYDLVSKDGDNHVFSFPVSPQVEPIKRRFWHGPRWWLVISTLLIILGNSLFGLVGGLFFDELFQGDRPIQIVAHRAGGDLAAENSLLGLEKAISMGATWSEIDVQRTKDGVYVINHDQTFARLSGVRKSSQEMTWDEIEKLAIKDTFDSSRPSQPVSRLEDYLEKANGKIKLMIELKGTTADEQMVDDLVKIVNDYDMVNQVALISLDYGLIKLIEQKYPQINTGYLYFFAIGSDLTLVSDMYLIEEQMANPNRVQQIKDLGKSVIVWTVNQAENLPRLIDLQVDGVITDRIQVIRDEIEARSQRSDLELILDKIIND